VGFYLVYFNRGDMNLTEEDLPQVDAAISDVKRRAIYAGDWVVAGGLNVPEASIVATATGDVHTGVLPSSTSFLGGLVVLKTATVEETHDWASQIAQACRCDQEVRAFYQEPGN
jgi:hypothetical protein